MIQIDHHTNKACHLLGMFLLQRIQQQQEEKEITELTSEINYDYDYDTILIEEASKPIIIQNPKRLRKSSSKTISLNNIKQERNVNLIMISLANFKGFVRYIKYQNLSKEDIKKTAEVIKHQFYKRGTYIFRENDESDAFYGIIRGKVSIRKTSYIDYTQQFHDEIAKEENNDIQPILNLHNPKTNSESSENISSENFISEDGVDEYKPYTHNNNNNNKSLYNLGDEFEYEVYTACKGMCFGEWGLVHDTPRTVSVYCIEDTHVFKLEKEHFDKILGNKFFKSDMNKINFLLRKIPIMNNNINFQYLLPNITPSFYDKGSYVYTQFDKANYIYIIYQGECSYVYLHNATSKDDFILKHHDIKYISSLSVGAITGLEAYKRDNLNYEGNLLVTRDFTVLLQINMDYINDKIQNEFDLFIKPLYDTQRLIIEDNMNLILHKNNDMKSSSSKNKCFLSNNKYQQQQMETIVNDIRHEIQHDKNINILNKKTLKKCKVLKLNLTSMTIRNKKTKMYIKYNNNNNNNYNVIRNNKERKFFETEGNYLKDKCNNDNDDDVCLHKRRLEHVNSMLVMNTSRNKMIKEKGNVNGVYIYAVNTEASTIVNNSSRSCNKGLTCCKSWGNKIKKKKVKEKALKRISLISNYTKYVFNAKEVNKNGRLNKKGSSFNKVIKYKYNDKENNKEGNADIVQLIYKRKGMIGNKSYDSGKFKLPLVNEMNK